MSKHEMSNKKFEEMMNKYGSVEEFSKVLYEANVIPNNPIVFDDYTIPVNDLARCMNVDLKTTINRYLESRFSEAEMIQKLGASRLTKNEVVDKLVNGKVLENEQSPENSSVSNESMATVQNGSHEMLKFQRSGFVGKNPIYSDGSREIIVNNNGTNAVSYACAVYMTRFIEGDEANLVQLNLMDATAEKVIYKHAYMNTVTATLDEMKNLATQGKAFDINNLLIILDTFTDTSKLLYRSELDSVANKLYEIHKVYEDGYFINFEDKLGFIRNTMASLKDCENEIRKIMNKMDKTISDNTVKEGEFGKKNCVEKLENENDQSHNLRIGKLNKVLEDAKYLKIYRYKVIDSDGKQHSKSKTIATKEKPWVFDTDIVITGTDKSTTFKLTHFGKFVFENLYSEAQLYLDGKTTIKELSNKFNKDELLAQYIDKYMDK